MCPEPLLRLASGGTCARSLRRLPPRRLLAVRRQPAYRARSPQGMFTTPSPLRGQPAANVLPSEHNGRVARPTVGITSYVTPATFGVWELECALVPYDYVRAVERSGGRALLVPPADGGLEETLDALDGLILSGGSDLDPGLYGQQVHPETNGVVPARDRAELALLQAALERDLPVLAICRGSQVLNVALGGELIQHLPEHVGHEKHKEVPGSYSEHAVAVEPETRLAELLGGSTTVKSHHHQGHARLGAGLRAVAHDDDGGIEALEVEGKRFALGVLWHPEAGEDARLFDELVEQARRYRAETRE
jgi:putative glutamine amidotransferase